MSATEDDTELRDLLIQNLENNGVLNKLKAEMRAAVFLAMEEQDKLENKSPLVNENLKKCLNTRDGRLVAGLIVDFLQVFNLDFSLAVFQPETNSASLNSVDSREVVCRDLGLSESEVNRKCPLLLELVTRGRHKASEEPSQKRITLAQKTFDLYDKDGSGSVGREDVKNVFTDLFPGLNKTMLEHFITDELRAADQSFPCTVDFQMFVGFYKRLFSQCRAVVFQDSSGGSPEQKVHSPVSKHLDSKASLGKVDVQLPRSRPGGASLGPERRHVDQEEEEEEEEEEEGGDSFFDDPMPKPQKTYGW
nr:FGFR1 oncogene partner isoform X2 [Gasterosteus aculeatus aculeatus]